MRAALLIGFLAHLAGACSVDGNDGRVFGESGGAGGNTAGSGDGEIATSGRGTGGNSGGGQTAMTTAGNNGIATSGRPGVGGSAGGESSVSGGSAAGGAPDATGGALDSGNAGDAAGEPSDGGNQGTVAGAGLGEACQQGGDCVSGHCVEELCCSAACDGTCIACTSAETGQPDGTCAPVEVGTDPKDDCSESADTCGRDGECDGAGACRYQGPMIECAAQICEDGLYTPPSHCNGEGECTASDSLPCSACAGGACNVACATSAQCPTGFYCDGTTCAATQGQGGTCEDAEECTSGQCVEGVCCDTACVGTCTSCRQINTGLTDGKCGNVKAGTSHGSGCTAQAATTCGLDGTCDGAGGCRKHAAGTVCSAAMCPSGSTTRTAQRTCDGSGVCSTASTSSCANYACNSSTASCRTSCSGASDCASSAYCSGSSCTAKKAPGALCSAVQECTSNRCGGRCCNTNESCNCPQPSAQNLIENPGFDSGLSSWAITSGPGGVSHQSAADDPTIDYDGCQFSGSAYVSFPEQTDQRVWQCVSLTSHTDYNFGVRIRADGFSYCDLDLYPGANCTGSPANMVQANWINVAWSHDFDTAFDSGQNTSAKVSCYTDGAGALWFDKVYVSRSPAKY